MLSSRWLVALVVLSLPTLAHAQRRDTTSAPSDAAPASEPAAGSSNVKWRTANAGTRSAGDPVAPADTQQPLRPISSGGLRQPIANVTKGPDSLPTDAGQEWRVYDISSYTTRVTSTSRPEQAILDWILRETGYEAWHTEPFAFLSANRRTLNVYHTPEMHAIVGEMVDRFVNTEAESNAFGMRIITMGSPDWRVKAQRMMHPVATQAQGVQAWLLAREDAALLLADLRRRTLDFKEHSTPHLLVNNGQSTQVSAMKPRQYVRDLIFKAEAWPGFEMQQGHYDEGFKIEFNPLLSLDGKVVDAVLRAEVDQIEKMIPVVIDVPSAANQRQRAKVEVPQPVSVRLHERFRWPTEQVLLISLGVVPTPLPPAPTTFGVKVPLISAGTRADFLIFIESKGKLAAPATALQPGQQPQYRGRY